MLKEVCPAPSVVFDLGVKIFSEIMKQNNYKVYNTNGGLRCNYELEFK